MFTSIKSFNLSKTVTRCTMGLSHTESNNLNLSKGCILAMSDLLPHLYGATETLLMLITQMLLLPKDVCRFSCFFKSRSVFLTITRLASLEFSKQLCIIMLFIMQRCMCVCVIYTAGSRMGGWHGSGQREEEAIIS